MKSTLKLVKLVFGYGCIQTHSTLMSVDMCLEKQVNFIDVCACVCVCVCIYCISDAIYQSSLFYVN